MTLRTPLWQQDSTYSATIDRELIDAVFAAPGIVLTSDLLVAQRAAGANMSVDVAAGKCVVTGTDTSGQGKYLCMSDAVTNVTIATAPGTGLSRIDLIVAQVRDQDQNGLAHNDWIITAVTGTAATTGTQVAPGAPATSLIIAQIAVGPNVTTIVTANITDKRAQITLGGSSTGVLTSHHYAPTTENNSNVFPTGASAFGVLDSTNLIVPSFTLPASGKAAVVISLVMGTSGASVPQVALALFQHSGTTKYGPTVQPAITAPTAGFEIALSVTFVITGSAGQVIPALDLYGHAATGTTVLVQSYDAGGSTSVAPGVSGGGPFDSIVYPLV